MKFFKSFLYALKGVSESVKTGRNLRVQIVCAIYVFIAAPFFMRSPAEWAALILTVALVISSEIFNTALEHLTDQTVSGYAPLARAAKDAAAGAVIMCSVAAVIVAAILFIKPDELRLFFAYCKENIWFPISLILLLIPAGLFIRGKKPL